MDKEHTKFSLMDKEHTKCNFCNRASKYICPRCNIPFCSSACYNNSSHKICSEEFCKNMVEQELKHCQSSPESRQKMVDILRRIEHDDSEVEPAQLDSDDEEELTDRLQGVDLGNADAIWEHLSLQEQEEFKSMLKEGELGGLIPPWSPWWEQDVPKIQIIEGTNEVAPYVQSCPPVNEGPPLASLTKATPSTCVPFNILNVLAAYAWTTRLFNGDHLDSCQDASEAILSLSSVLLSDANYEEAPMAIESPKMLSQNYTWLRTDEAFQDGIFHDVLHIATGPNVADQAYYIRAAMSDLHALLTTCKISLSKKKPHKSTSPFMSSLGMLKESIELKNTTLSVVKKALKKLEFFLAYATEFGDAVLKAIHQCNQPSDSLYLLDKSQASLKS